VRPRKPAPKRFSLIPHSKLRWGILASLAIVAWVAFNFVTLGEYVEARKRRNQTRGEVGTLEQNYAQLVTQKQELETWGFSAEKALRERYKMVNPGESLLLLDAETSD